MAYTEQTNDDASYIVAQGTVTTWDAAWDVIGNVDHTAWDVSPTEYSLESGSLPVYTEQ